MPTEQTNIVPGTIVEGKVQGITKFGAFIELPDGTVGLVHISEIADTYVKDVKDFIQEGDNVKVKVLNVAGKKIGLSIKQAKIPEEKALRKYSQPRSPSAVNNSHLNKNSGQISLDEKIARFLKESDERMQPLKAKNETKRRTYGSKNMKDN